MKNFKITFSFLLLVTLISCGKNEKIEESPTIKNTEQKKEQQHTVATEDNISLQKEDTLQTPTDSIDAIKESVLGNQNYKKKEEPLVVDHTTETNTTETNTIPTKITPKKTGKRSFVYIKKILNECETGVTMTQEDLESKFKIPKEAMKLVKSITKVAPNELEIKWKSTWLVEKVSDAKFKDGRLKVRFEDNKMYTSGGAISIKYEKKMYSDLILIGRSAYIPTVKGYYWQIGKDNK
ncbi:hypothetical protein [Flavobacterium sp. 5]|uniref:hypothetical protein n=1 Tax=Flavobacterium sp. 5 TaxID=2035199 RepID=UPI000C2B9A3B|nr:hypothetical protein [Flavobacterium sp. 5]PKB16232.1 hypothetical protein CLU82_1356 [Flavobacterium sp. 5]